jgi:hypothetical protein
MVDGAGGFFTAFKAAMSVGRRGGQEGGDEGDQTAPGASYPGAIENHPGFDEGTGCCTAHPQGCANSLGGGTPHPYFADEWVAEQRQGGAWSHPANRNSGRDPSGRDPGADTVYRQNQEMVRSKKGLPGWGK